MSAFDEVITALQSVVDELDNTANATNTARSEADDASNQAAALGATQATEGLSLIKDGIDQLDQQIRAAIDRANELVEQAKAVADGT